MKIPILAAFALMALVGANDVDDELVSTDENERRLDDRGWYPDDATEECGWKVFKYDGKCVKNYYCKDPPNTGGYKKQKGMYIDDDYCGISSSSSDSSSSDSSSSSSDCKKWKKKYKKCKKKNSKKKVSMHTFSTPVIAIVAYMYNLTWLTLSLFSWMFHVSL